MNKKYVVLADIESVRVPYASFDKALKELTKDGEIATCKFYGFSSKRTKDYKPFIAENYYEALPKIKNKRKGKLDLRQVIDAVNISNHSHVDGFFLMYGSGDIQPLISWLKASGSEVIAGVTEEDANSALCSRVIKLDTTPSIHSNNVGGYKQVDASAETKKPVTKKAKSDEDKVDDDIIAQLGKLLG